MMCKAQLRWRSPRRLRRCRVVMPDEAGIGATPPSIAKALSLRMRPGWDHTTRVVAATMGPTPTSSSRSGRQLLTSASMCSWCASASERRVEMRRARAFMASPTATVDTSPVGHQRVQTSTICAVERPRSLAARTSGQVLASDTRWRSVSPIISTDERRATKRGREDIAVAGVARCGQVVPAQGFACHSRGVEVVGLLAHGRGWPAGAPTPRRSCRASRPCWRKGSPTSFQRRACPRFQTPSRSSSSSSELSIQLWGSWPSPR